MMVGGAQTIENLQNWKIIKNKHLLRPEYDEVMKLAMRIEINEINKKLEPYKKNHPEFFV